MYMMPGSTAVNDGTTITTTLSDYEGKINGLSSSWKGTSYDSFNDQTTAFVGEYKPIADQLNSFGTACDEYIKYEQLKKDLIAMEEQKSQMIANNETSGLATINNEIETTKRDIESTKAKINDALSSAGSTKLEATTLSASVASSVAAAYEAAAAEAAKAATTTTSGAQNPNLTYSAKYDNYAFPFENGVNAPVTSSVGYRNAPTAGASTNHKGTDIGVEYGTPIHAIQGGTVEAAGREGAGGFGNRVVIRQDDGKLTTYGHVSESGYYNVGDRVETGAVIANVGSEGVSTGPHLHLQIEDTDGSLCDAEEIFEGVWPG